MVIFILISLIILKTTLTITLLPSDRFIFVFWKAMALYGAITLSFALFLSINDPMYYIDNHGGSIIKISILEAFFVISSLFILKWLKPKSVYISNVALNKTIKLMLIISMGYFLISIKNFLQPSEISLNESLFPFGLFIENIARISPFFGAYYWEKLNKTNRYWVVALVIVFYLYAIPSGSRGLLLLSGFFLLFWCYKGGLLKSIALGLTFVLLYSQVEDVHRSFRVISAMSVNNESRVEQLQSTSLDDTGADNVGFIESFRKRVTHGVALMGPIDNYLIQREPVGLDPLLSSLQSIMPQKFLESEKPWPGSTDGTKYTSFGYLVNDIATGEWWNMSEYPSVLHPIWELGYLYYFISIFISGAVLAIMLRISKLINDNLYIVPLAAIYPFTYSRFHPQIIELPLMINYVLIPGVLIFLLAFIFRLKIGK